MMTILINNIHNLTVLKKKTAVIWLGLSYFSLWRLKKTCALVYGLFDKWRKVEMIVAEKVVKLLRFLISC